MKCFKCGTDVPQGSRFCLSCGVEVTDPASATVMVTTDARDERDALLHQLRKALAGEYEIEKELGRGGMAIVFKGLEVALHRPVALKVMPPEMSLGGTAAERFKREARMAAALDHPNIIPIHRVGLVGNIHYIAMKFIEGRALDAIIEAQGALALPVVVTALQAAASGLAFAHERGIIHRDIKGANILVDRDGRVFVSDFGIARAVQDSTLTASGAVIGTPQFMSPEQCAGQKVGPQSDQYSLGILAFQMLTGATPFDAESVIAIMQHHFFSPVPDIRGVREGVPDGLVEIVNRLLAKDPAQRYGSTGDLVSALEALPVSEAERRSANEALRGLTRGAAVPKVRTGSLPPLPDTRSMGMASAPTTPIPPSRPPPPPKKRSRVPLVVGAALLVGGAGVGTYVFLAPAPAPPLTPLRRDSASTARAESTRPPPAAPPVAAPARTDSAAVRDRARRAAPRVPPSTTPPAPVGIGLVRLRTDPSDASIYIDGDKKGAGTLFDFEIPAGSRRLRITAPGYVTFDSVITVVIGQTTRLGLITLRSTP